MHPPMHVRGKLERTVNVQLTLRMTALIPQVLLKFSWTSSRKQCPREQILDHSFAKQAWVSNHWFDTYPDAMQEIRWAKRAWKAGCEELEARILSNSEIIKLVCIWPL